MLEFLRRQRHAVAEISRRTPCVLRKGRARKGIQDLQYCSRRRAGREHRQGREQDYREQVLHRQVRQGHEHRVAHS